MSSELDISTPVKGTCPGCGSKDTLFIGSGGFITCSWVECGKPEAASDLLDNVPTEESVRAQQRVLMEALHIYEGRHRKRGDMWKTIGWRGTLFNTKLCIQRAWYTFWDGSTNRVEVTAFGESEPRFIGAGDMADMDTLFDTINYAALTVRAVRDGNRDGDKGWWG